MRERAVRRATSERLKAAGAWVRGLHGNAYTAGLPDLVAARDGVVVWLEIKAPGGRVSPLQEETHRVMRSYGLTVLVGSDASSLVQEALEAFSRGAR